MSEKDFYSNAHLVVAAIRILENRNSEQPSVNDACKILSMSVEQGNLLCKKLDEAGIIKVVVGAFDSRLFLKDHLKIEEIPRDEQDASLQDEVEKFQSSRLDIDKRVLSIQSDQATKQRDLFAEIEKKLKQGLDDKK